MNKILQGDALTKLKELDSDSIQLCITSPPYYKMRDYQVDGQLGQEDTPAEYIKKLADIFDEVKRVLKPEGSAWINITDKIENKTLLRIPEKLTIELEARGWLSPQTVIWNKSNGMPAGGGNSKVRFNIDFEYFYHFTKTRDYYFKQQYEPMKEALPSKWLTVNPNKSQEESRHGLQKYTGPKIGGNHPENYNNTNYSGIPWNVKQIELSDVERANAIKLGWDGVSDYAEWYFTKREKKGWHNHESDEVMGFGHQGRGEGKLKLAYPYGSIKRAVWRIPHAMYPDAHFATFPEELIETPIKACSKPKDLILDPFMGSGTTALVAWKNARNFLGIELSQEYITMAMQRLKPYLLQTRLPI